MGMELRRDRETVSRILLRSAEQALRLPTTDRQPERLPYNVFANSRAFSCNSSAARCMFSFSLVPGCAFS